MWDIISHRVNVITASSDTLLHFKLRNEMKGSRTYYCGQSKKSFDSEALLERNNIIFDKARQVYLYTTIHTLGKSIKHYRGK